MCIQCASLCLRLFGFKLCARSLSLGNTSVVNKLQPLTVMGKTTYADASGTIVPIPAAQYGNAEPMPQVPKASTFVASPKKKANQRSPDAAAYLCVSKVCSDAMIYKDDKGVCLFPGISSVNKSVFLVTLSHPNAYPQIDFKVVDKIDAMLKTKFVESVGRPRDWNDLVQKLHIVTINTGTFAPYNLPYHNWQRAFYVAGDASVCENFVMELDNYIVYNVEHQEKPKYGNFPLKVQLGLNIGFNLVADDFDYPSVEIVRDVRLEEMAVTPLNVYPPQGVRPLVVHFEVVNADEVAITMFGDTYRHREALNNAGLEFCKDDAATNSADLSRTTRQETFYIMGSKDVSVKAEAVFVQNLLTSVVENVIVDVRMFSLPYDGSATHTCVQALKMTPNLMVREV